MRRLPLLSLDEVDEADSTDEAEDERELIGEGTGEGTGEETGEEDGEAAGEEEGGSAMAIERQPDTVPRSSLTQHTSRQQQAAAGSAVGCGSVVTGWLAASCSSLRVILRLTSVVQRLRGSL